MSDPNVCTCWSGIGGSMSCPTHSATARGFLPGQPVVSGVPPRRYTLADVQQKIDEARHCGSMDVISASRKNTALSNAVYALCDAMEWLTKTGEGGRSPDPKAGIPSSEEPVGRKPDFDTGQGAATSPTPCPFCGEYSTVFMRSSLGKEMCWLTCQGCRCHGPSGASETEATEAWNRRVSGGAPMRAAPQEAAIAKDAPVSNFEYVTKGAAPGEREATALVFTGARFEKQRAANPDAGLLSWALIARDVREQYVTEADREAADAILAAGHRRRLPLSLKPPPKICACSARDSGAEYYIVCAVCEGLRPPSTPRLSPADLRPPEPSAAAIKAAFAVWFGKDGGPPDPERDGPELAGFERLLEAAYAIDGVGRPPVAADLRGQQRETGELGRRLSDAAGKAVADIIGKSEGREEGWGIWADAVRGAISDVLASSSLSEPQPDVCRLCGGEYGVHQPDCRGNLPPALQPFASRGVVSQEKVKGV